MHRRLHPGSDRIDLVDMVFEEERTPEGRPWFMFNMVASIDGATAVAGGSSALNDPDDKELFAALRTVPDMILVGAGTVRAENYRPVTLDEGRRSRRAEHGLEPTPRLAIVSGALSVTPDMRVFGDPEHMPLVLTGNDVPSERVDALAGKAEVVQLPTLDPASIVSGLGDPTVVLCEGGPTLNGQLMSAGYVDEVNLTISPLVAVGESHRIAHGEDLRVPMEMRLLRTLVGDRALFLRYVRADQP